MVWPWRDYCCDIWLTMGEKHHGGEALLTKKDAYHVEGEVMINMVRYVEPMVDF